ncbi:hypothetical protein [Lutibacter sp.]|uniref:hypothetical protein n=1 Tax=Lutibacter sp. TaxID=1925666 RepID=UPI00356B2E49
MKLTFLLKKLFKTLLNKLGAFVNNWAFKTSALFRGVNKLDVLVFLPEFGLGFDKKVKLLLFNFKLIFILVLGLINFNSIKVNKINI